MAYPASPYSRSFQNLNVCRSFNVSCTTTKAALTGEECSEVLVLNKTGQDVYIYDAGYHQTDNRFILADGDSMTFRGMTNSDQVSAQTASGSGTLYYRTQHYSMTPLIIR
mgnify:CR=1 FL=1